MDNMLTINCACKQSFNVMSRNLLKKETLFCPNCECQVPTKILNDLKALVDIDNSVAYEGSAFTGRSHSLQLTLEYCTPKKS